MVVAGLARHTMVCELPSDGGGARFEQAPPPTAGALTRGRRVVHRIGHAGEGALAAFVQIEDHHLVRAGK